MEDEYMIFESKMNSFSLEELEEIKPKTTNVILNRIKELSPEANTADLETLYKLGGVLGREAKNKPLEALKLPRGIIYDTTWNNYKARITKDGKKITLKTSKDLHFLVAWLKDYCKENKIIGYGEEAA